MTPAARNPAGAVTLTAPPPRSAGPVVSGSPSARFAHWTAAPAVPLVRLSMRRRRRPGRCARRGRPEVHGVAAEDGRGLGPLPFGQQVHERLVGVGLLLGRADPAAVTPGGRGGAGGEDAARHRREGRGERDGHRLAGGARRGSARSPGCAGARRRRRTATSTPITSAPSRCGLSDLPAPDVPLAATTTTSSGSSDPGREAGGERERDRRRVAARARRCGAAPERARGAAGRGARAGRRATTRRTGAVEPAHAAASASRKSAPQSTTTTSSASRRRGRRTAPCGSARTTTSWPASTSRRGVPRTRSASGVRCGWMLAERAARRSRRR